MAYWNKSNSYRWDNEKWRKKESSAGFWLRRIAAASLILAIIFLADLSGTTFGQKIVQATRDVLTVPTDFRLMADNFIQYVENDLHLPVLNRVKDVISRPAQPLNYMSMPVSGAVVPSKDNQSGIILKTKPSEPVKAAAPGKVTKIGDVALQGKYVVIDHGTGVETYYSRIERIVVKKDDIVSQEQVIGFAFASKDECLIYFEVRENGKAVDPASRLTKMHDVTERK